MADLVAAPRRDQTTPDYGLDAPSVVRGFLAAGAMGVVLVVLNLLGLWSTRHWSAAIFMPLTCAGVAFLVTGLYMVWYSRVGKVRARERYLDRLPWRGDEQVLDVGCGRGLFLVAAARRLDKGGRAVGVDLWQAEDLAGNSPDATLANARLEGVADRVDVKTGDARQLPFPDASFDTVVSSVALHNIYDEPGRRQAIREIARVLKPGGRLLIVDIRHTHEYADELRRTGCDAVARRGPLSYLATLCTFGSLRSGVVTGEKR
jgi:SAM-dependent methyltransferase